jgi:amidase
VSIPADWTATALAAAVRRGEVTPRALAAEALRRIDRYDGEVGAFQLVRHEAAVREADQVDVSGGLPLAGVPIAIKDNVDVAGEPTRDGSLSTPEGPRPADHEVVRRLRAAGAVVVGKTRVPELCVFAATDSPFGITRNPWQRGRTPGGSSGGSAAAVAAGMVPVAHGNDGMGSVRIPAACCGLVGIKPGAGVVPADLGANDWYGLAENGVLATTVDDAALVLSVIADQESLATIDTAMGPLSIAVTTNSPMVGIAADGEYKRAVHDAGELLAKAGHKAADARMPYTTRFGLAAIARWTAGTADDADLFDRSRLQPSIRRHAAVGAVAKRRGWPQNDGRDRWRAHLRRIFDRFDVVMTPALARPPIAAVRWGGRGWLRNVNANARYAPFQNAWNLAGYPAIVVPMGLHSSGVPLSVQLAAPSGGEATLLALARQIEELQPWQRHAPGFDG